MSKYDGIKVVDIKSESVNQNTVSKASQEGGSFFSGFIMRVLAGALIIGGLFSVKLINHPIAEKAVESVKSAVTYDINSRDAESFGEIKFIELMKKYFNNKE